MTQRIEWAVDTEGVHVCSYCWDDEMRAYWMRVEAVTGMYCESCLRYARGSTPPKWLREARAELARWQETRGNDERSRAADAGLLSPNPTAPVAGLPQGETP